MSQRPGSTLMPSVEMTSAPAGTCERADLADGADALAVDQDDAVPDRTAAVAVDQRSTDERFEFPLPLSMADVPRRPKTGSPSATASPASTSVFRIRIDISSCRSTQPPADAGDRHDAIGIPVVILYSVHPCRCLEIDRFGRAKAAREAGLRIVARPAVSGPIPSNGLIVWIAFFLDEVAAAPEEYMTAPAARFPDNRPKNAAPSRLPPGALRSGTNRDNRPYTSIAARSSPPALPPATSPVASARLSVTGPDANNCPP